MTAETVTVELEKLSKDNQTLYSTHSPFMIDGNHLECARAVYEDDDGTTKISEDVWPRDKDSLFPLQAALGYQLAQSLFVAKKQVIVEGITDYWIIKALAMALERLGKSTLSRNVALVPSAGVSKLLPLASMLIGHDVEVAALLDGDEPARREGKKLVDKLLAGDDRRCLFIGDFIPSNSAGEIEDVFPEADYLSAVKEVYPDVDLTFTADENGKTGVIEKLRALFSRKGLGGFEKWQPAAVLRDRILSSPQKLPAQVATVMSGIFGRLNELFERSPGGVAA